MQIFYSWQFIAFCILFIASLFCFKLKPGIGITCLIFSALFLRLFIIHLDPFLHDWDEKFHALVARNMMSEPFKPYLRESLLSYDYRAWCCNYIWLHKQPLFMWQMALSMKLFGVSEITVRYPSVLMGALMVLLIYRMAKIATANGTIAFIAAMFMCVSNYQLELIAGYHGMDHNDTAFSFYVIASIWAYLEYERSPQKGWIFSIGLLAGCAVLNKWLTGLLVFAVWGIIALIYKRSHFTKELKRILASFAVALVVFLPWQLYILKTFPTEATYEYAYNAKHLFEAVEGHAGTIWYYLEHFSMYFGNMVWWLLVAGLILLFAMRKYSSKTAISLAVAFFILFIFFSFIVQSKLHGYFFAIAPAGYIFMAIAVEQLLSWVKAPATVKLIAATTICFVILDTKEIRSSHDSDDSYRQAKIHNTAIYKNLRSYIPDSINYVMNANNMEDVEVMFYNKGIVAHHYYPDPESIERLKSKNIPIASFPNRHGYQISWDVVNYPFHYIIKADLK